MVGTNRNRDTSLLLHIKQGTHHIEHRHIAFKMIGFVEVTIGIALGAAQMHKVYAIGKPTHHLRQIIVGSNAERACAQTQSVAVARHGIDDSLEVVGST